MSTRSPREVGAVSPAKRRSAGRLFDASGPYDAFLSYSHHDRAAARGVQRGLHAIGRRFGQLRALRVFRDASDLTASPDLWAKVTEAMDASRYFVLLLSPAAAASTWVRREVSYWLDSKGPESLFLVVADGTLVWDDDAGRFDPGASTAAPALLTRPSVLPAEPLFVDVSRDAPWDPKDPVFRERVTDLAAPIHGKGKAELAGEDVREQRRVRRLRNTAVAALALLTVLSVIAASVAVTQTREARLQRDQALALALVSESRVLLATNPALALALATEAPRLAPEPLPEASAAIWSARQASARKIGQPVGDVLSADFREGHPYRSVASVAFSRDGSLLAAAGNYGNLALWESRTGQRVRALSHLSVGFASLARDQGVTSIAFGPTGQLLAVAVPGGTVLLGDSSVSDESARLDSRRGDIRSLEFRPDGRMLASAGFTGVQLWDLQMRKPVGDRLTDQLVNSVAFNPNGTLLASAGDDGTVRLWDPTTGKPIGEPLTEHTGPAYSVAFGPDGNSLASAGDDGTVRLWDPQTRESVGEPLTGHTGAVNSVAFNPNGTLLATAGDDGTVRLWDPSTGKPVGEALTRHTGPVSSVAFSPEGDLLASATPSGEVLLWDPRAREPAREPLTGHTGAVNSVAFNPDGTLLASAGDDETVRLWNPTTGNPVGEPLTRHTGAVNSVAFNPNGTLLASAGDDGTVRLWSPQTREPIGEPLTGHTGAVNSVAFNPNGTLLASAGDDGTVRLWDPRTRQPVGEPLHGMSFAFSPQGVLIALGQDNSFILVREVFGSLATPQVWISDSLNLRSSDVTSVAFSPDGTLLASAGADRWVRLWHPFASDPDPFFEAVGDPLAAHAGPVYSLAFSPDGTLLASGSADETVRLWDPQTGRHVGEPVTGHTGEVRSVAFSRAGDVLASAGEDAEVRLWPTAWATLDVCALTEPYVSAASLEQRLPEGWAPACQYER